MPKYEVTIDVTTRIKKVVEATDDREIRDKFAGDVTEIIDIDDLEGGDIREVSVESIHEIRPLIKKKV